MQIKYGNLFNTTVHMQRHRLGVRGNVTSFPLPWQSLLQELQRLDQHHSEQKTPDLPRVGKDLAYVVQVLLKTADSESKPNLERLMHQATLDAKLSSTESLKQRRASTEPTSMSMNRMSDAKRNSCQKTGCLQSCYMYCLWTIIWTSCKFRKQRLPSKDARPAWRAPRPPFLCKGHMQWSWKNRPQTRLTYMLKG